MKLEDIGEKALQNGVDDLCFLNKFAVIELESEIDVRQVCSPLTFDWHPRRSAVHAVSAGKC